jgi:hypothetical protein
MPTYDDFTTEKVVFTARKVVGARAEPAPELEPKLYENRELEWKKIVSAPQRCKI